MKELSELPTVYQSIHFYEMPEIEAVVQKSDTSDDTMYLTLKTLKAEWTIYFNVDSHDENKDFELSKDFADKFSEKIMSAIVRAKLECEQKNEK